MTGRRQVLDPSDPAVRDYTALTDVALRTRREPAEGLYLAEGEKVLRRALAAGHRPRSLLLAAKRLDELADLVVAFEGDGVPVLLAEPAVLQAVTGFDVHRGVLASMHRPVPAAVPDLVRQARRVAVLEDVVDHTNVGAVFRSAAALGVDAVLVSPRCADPLYRRSVRVSMGGVFQVPWARLEPWPDGLRLLPDIGFVVAALALQPDAVPLDAFANRPEVLAGRVALLLGAEGDGLSGAAVAVADIAVTIPMAAGVDSLNVAAAAAVAFYALRLGD